MQFKPLLVAIAAAAACAAAQAGPILIVNGISSTSEVDTTNNITNNLKALHEAVGNVVTVVDGVPVDLSPYQQVWDIRFFAALTGGVQSQYVSFLQNGGGIFVMGENDGFMTRNTSLFNFIGAAGGGTLGPNFIGGCDGPQNVIGPFQGPNPVTSVNYACAGVVASKGTGDWITERATGGGSGVAWGKGDLTNAANGALTVIFDVNFMEGTRGVAQQNLTKNLIGFVGDQVGVPIPGTLALAVLGLAAMGGMRRRATKAA